MNAERWALRIQFWVSKQSTIIYTSNVEWTWELACLSTSAQE